MQCPLCLSSGPFSAWIHASWRNRLFYRCPGCEAVFVSAHDQVPPEKERERYETHNNDLAAPGFEEFLMRTVREIKRRLSPGSRILDFGSGPEPSMAILLRREGFEVECYDPFFAPRWPPGEFDMVLAHEVFEHLRSPRSEIERIFSALVPGGIFLIRSEPCPPKAAFESWWYARDFTHIFFCSEKTLDWIARLKEARLSLWSPTLWAFQSKGPAGNSRGP